MIFFWERMSLRGVTVSCAFRLYFGEWNRADLWVMAAIIAYLQRQPVRRPRSAGQITAGKIQTSRRIRPSDLRGRNWDARRYNAKGALPTRQLAQYTS